MEVLNRALNVFNIKENIRKAEKIKSVTEYTCTKCFLWNIDKTKTLNICLQLNNHYSAGWNSIFQIIIGHDVSHWNCPNYFQKINWSTSDWLREVFYWFGVFLQMIKIEQFVMCMLFVTWTEQNRGAGTFSQHCWCAHGQGDKAQMLSTPGSLQLSFWGHLGYIFYKL